MIEIKSDSFSKIDYIGLARLHIDSIPDTSFSIIGQQAAALMYRFIDESSKEILLAATIDGIVCGGIVVSYEPATITKRFIKSYTLSFLTSSIPSLLRKIHKLPELLRLLAMDEPYKYAPELMFLYTEPELRSKGIGGKLVQKIAALMKGVTPSLYVRTLDKIENRAIAFYERNGFKRHETVEYLGKAQVVMLKEI